MQILKLILNNFGSYENENIFDFTVGSGKSIILIGGKNGAGKTSMFTAIKIAFYGSLAFGYSAENSFYFRKIKNFINNKAFQTEGFISEVRIQMSLKNEREVKIYTMSRQWTIVNQKLTENYTVLENDKVLNESEKIFFDNYLQSLIPPDMFDFFLFDGEEIGNVFSSDNYHKYVKNSLLTICGLDIFSTIQNFCKSYVGKVNSTEDKENIEKYQLLEHEILSLQTAIDTKESTVCRYEQEIDSLVVAIEQKKQEFLRAGGIQEEKIRQFDAELKELSEKREQISRKLKAFFENMMPLYIVRSMIPKLRNQIIFEEKQLIYEYVSFMIPEEFLKKSLAGKIENSEVLSKQIYQDILDRLRPTKGISTEIIFDLSTNEQGKMEQIIDEILDVEPQEWISMINQKNSYTERINEINKYRREALSEEDSQKYIDEINELNQKIENLKEEKTNCENEISHLQYRLYELENERKALYTVLMENTQNKNIVLLSNKISRIMERLIDEQCINLRKSLSEKTIMNLQQIYRKENLIAIVEVTEDFRFNLYQKQSFTVLDMKSLLANLGSEEFYSLIGDESRKILSAYFNVSDNTSLTIAINLCSDETIIFDLYKRINLNTLSKGERQIFILAFYKAIIQISGKDIPFIIDTPYARIDAGHREEISKRFFPEISSQVVILSTDEEITKEYYKIIQPFISKEYLLRNDKAENRTTVTRGYFFKEDE